MTSSNGSAWEDRRDGAMIFVGINWAEAHHDVRVLAAAGDVLVRARGNDHVK